MPRTRYPGAQPFREEESDIFFGRGEELDKLATQVMLEPLTVLYGKSGLGKSSLINAGLIPKLVKEEQLNVLKVRFFPAQIENAGQKEINTNPAQKTINTILQNGIPNLQVLDQLVPQDNSIWSAVRRCLEEKAEEKTGLLLIFDQFEELFTYPGSAIHEFRRQLSEAIYTPFPQRFWEALDNAFPQGRDSPEQLSRIQSAPAELKILFSVRSDRFHLLERLDDYLPSILRNCIELHPLSLSEAKRAIVEPAKLAGDFDTESFSYHPDALADILGFLTRNGQKSAESAQLQIVCDYLAKQISPPSKVDITTIDTVDLPAIITQHYERKLMEIADTEERIKARILIEDQLIFVEEKRRLSMYGGQVLRQIGPKTLEVLVNGHLLRAEPNLDGGYDYELSHDTLVAPILKARTERHKAESEARALAEQERLAVERKANRRKLLVAYTIALMGTTLAALAFYFARAANQARKTAETTLYQQTIDRANAFKYNGEYQSALNEIIQLSNLAEALGLSSELEIKRDTFSRLLDYQQTAESFSQDSLFYTLQQYKAALTYAPDAYLATLVNQINTDLKEQVRRELDLLRSALLDEDPRRIKNHLRRLQLLAPDQQEEIAEIMKRYQR